MLWKKMLPFIVLIEVTSDTDIFFKLLKSGQRFPIK